MGEKPKRIVDTPAVSKLLKELQGFEQLVKLINQSPQLQKQFPGLKDSFTELPNLKEQAKILLIPDLFNETFSSRGWIAYESIKLETMETSLDIAHSDGIDAAEDYLANCYNSETLELSIMQFNGHKDFRKRIRLVNLAKDDYLSERYHACVPLLLSILDGVVNDISQQVGFFAKTVDMTGWDCIAANESGLQAIKELMDKPCKKTSESTITIPYRHGILHGRELSYDNKLVAAKCWSTLFAVRDWAKAISDGKINEPVHNDISIDGLFQKLAENKQQDILLNQWRARDNNSLTYLPHSGDSSDLPKDTPEYIAATFLDHWCNRRYGPLSDLLKCSLDISPGKKAGMAKNDFGDQTPIDFTIISVEDIAAAISIVHVEILFTNNAVTVSKNASIRLIYEAEDGNILIRGYPNGNWKIFQASLGNIIYSQE